MKNFIFLMLCFLFLMSLSCSSSGSTPSPGSNLSTAIFASNMKLGVITDGSQIQKDIAEQSIKALGLDLNITLVPETATTDAEMKAAINHLLAQDIHMIVGGSTTGQVVQALTLLENQPVLLISPSSTSPILDSPRDGLVRLAPSDDHQGDVLAKIMQDDGIECVFSLYRQGNGIYGLGLAAELERAVKELGMQFRSRQSFSMQDTLLESVPFINTAVQQMGVTINNSFQSGPESSINQKACSPNNTAIQVSAYDEITAVLDAASQIPVFSQIKWYGSDGFTYSNSVIDNSGAVQFAQKVNLLSPIFAVPSTKEDYIRYLEWYCSMLNLGSDRNITVYDGNFYDSITLAAKTLEAENNKPINLMTLIAAINKQADALVGVTGSLKLDENEDRAAAIYNFFGIDKTSSGNGYQWALKRAGCSGDTNPTCFSKTISPNSDLNIPLNDVCSKLGSS